MHRFNHSFAFAFLVLLAHTQITPAAELVNPVDITARLPAPTKPSEPLDSAGRATLREVQSATNPWTDRSIFSLRQTPAGDAWLAHVIGEVPIIRYRDGLSGSKEERDAAAANIEQRVLASVCRSVRWRPSAKLLDALSYRLLFIPEGKQQMDLRLQIDAHTRMNILLTVLMHRPDFIGRWQNLTLQSVHMYSEMLTSSDKDKKNEREVLAANNFLAVHNELILGLLTLENRLRRNLTGPLLTFFLRQPNDTSIALLEAMTAPEMHQNTLRETAEYWLQLPVKNQPTPNQWLALMIRMDSVPQTLANQRAQWLLATDNSSLATAAAISLLTHINSGAHETSEQLAQRAPAFASLSNEDLLHQRHNAPAILSLCIDLLLRQRSLVTATAIPEGNGLFLQALQEHDKLVDSSKLMAEAHTE